MAMVEDLKRNANISIGTLVMMIGGVISSTFAVTTTYNNFIHMQLQVDENKKDLESDLNVLDAREKKKHNRQQEDIEKGLSRHEKDIEDIKHRLGMDHKERDEFKEEYYKTRIKDLENRLKK